MRRGFTPVPRFPKAPVCAGASMERSMARPPKGPDDQRSEIVRCRMRPAEYLRIRQAAQRANLSLTDYARSMLLTGEVTIRQMRSLDPAAFDQLRRIGINLNQAVHSCMQQVHSPRSGKGRRGRRGVSPGDHRWFQRWRVKDEL